MVQQPYDFVIHWNDGTGLRLRPEWTSSKAICLAEWPHQDQAQPSAKGIGKSTETINLDVLRILFFDKAKDRFHRPLQEPRARGR